MTETDIVESLWRVENAIGAGFRNVRRMLAFTAIGHIIRRVTGAAVGILVRGLLVECWQWTINARRDAKTTRGALSRSERHRRLASGTLAPYQPRPARDALTPMTRDATGAWEALKEGSPRRLTCYG